MKKTRKEKNENQPISKVYILEMHTAKIGWFHQSIAELCIGENCIIVLSVNNSRVSSWTT